MLAAAGRIERWNPGESSLHFTLATPADVQVAARLLLPADPKTITVAGKPAADSRWDQASSTLLLRHPGDPKGVEVSVRW